VEDNDDDDEEGDDEEDDEDAASTMEQAHRAYIDSECAVGVVVAQPVLLIYVLLACTTGL
jgi:hypothetical protein